MYIDPFTRRIFNYATSTSYNNRPQNVIALDPDNDEHYLLTSKLVLRPTSMRFEPKQVRSVIG